MSTETIGLLGLGAQDIHLDYIYIYYVALFSTLEQTQCHSSISHGFSSLWVILMFRTKIY